MADTYRIELERGESLTFSVTMTYEGEAIDLTGHSGRLQIHLKADATGLAAPVLELTTDDGLTLTDEAGKYDVTITAAQSEALNEDNEKRVKYVWGLESYNADRSVVYKTVGRGELVVSYSLTRG